MNFATLYLILDFDGILQRNDRSFVLRACKEKILARFKKKCAVHSSAEDSALLIVSADNNLEKLKSTCEQVLDSVDDYSDVRILNEHIQYFSWFETSFFEIQSNHFLAKGKALGESQKMGEHRKSLLKTAVTKRRIKVPTRKF